MEKSILNIYGEVYSQVEEGILYDLKEFFDYDEKVQSYDIQINNKKIIIINIVMKKFSISSSKILFYDFVKYIGYDVNWNYYCEQINEVKYYYLTAMLQEDICTKMELVMK